jgi:hypothetical protein
MFDLQVSVIFNVLYFYLHDSIFFSFGDLVEPNRIVIVKQKCPYIATVYLLLNIFIKLYYLRSKKYVNKFTPSFLGRRE